MAILVGVTSAEAKDSVRIGVTPSLPTGLVYVAEHEGIFDKHDLDVEVITGNGSVLVAGIVSQSMDIALPTITTVLQAVDSGLPISIVAGGCLNVKADNRLLLKPGTDLKVAADFVGKTVGVSSIGATLYVEFQHWLISSGVDPSTVNFVEVSYSTMADVMKQGTLDAAVVPEPFASRIADSGAGVNGPDFSQALPDDLPILVFVANSDWIKGNGEVLGRFKDAINETIDLIQSDPDRAKMASNTYLKMPDAVLAKLTFPPLSTALDPKGIDDWISFMKPIGMLRTDISAKDAIY